MKIQIAENIKKYRTETQEVAAEKAELSVDMFSLAERGKSLLNSYNLTQVANALNVTPNHLDIHKSYDEYIEAKENIFKYV